MEGQENLVGSVRGHGISICICFDWMNIFGIFVPVGAGMDDSTRAEHVQRNYLPRLSHFRACVTEKKDP